MITIKNSHLGKTTYIIGKYFANGCTVAKIEDFDAVCDERDVHEYYRNQVKEALKAHNQDEDLSGLVEHDAWQVRAAVANQGYGLDKLVNNVDWYVRIAVAKQGYGLDKLVNDDHCHVRIAVANQGYGLDKLVDDDVWEVREAAKAQLEKLKM